MTENTSTSDSELELRLEKMRLEITELKRRQAWDRRVGRLLPIISALVPVLALVFAVQQFANQQNLTRDAMKRQAESERIAAERAFMQPVLSRQMNIYFEASAAAAKIASTQDSADKKKAQETFWELYWGPLVMLESQPVSGAMKSFGACLAESPRCQELKQRALALSSTLQSDLFESWKLSPDAYAQRSINYAAVRDREVPQETQDSSAGAPGPQTSTNKTRSRSLGRDSRTRLTHTDSKTLDSKAAGSKAPDPTIPDAKVPDSKAPGSKVPDSKVPKIPDSKVPNSKFP